MEPVRWAGRASLVVGVLLGCSSDKGERCPEGTAPGQSVSCSCGDSGTGTQMCEADNTLTDCDCSGTGMMGGTGGDTSSATGGTTSSGTGGSTSGTGGSSTGTGGTTPPMPEVDGGDMPADAGAPPSGTGGTVAPPPPPPMDGNQGAPCTDGTDCNMGLDCYTPGDGLDFCSAACDMDDDCTGIAGATYTCSMSTGVCHVECMGEDDTTSCPAGMVCMLTAGVSGLGGTFRCKYPAGPAMTQGFDECNSDGDCSDGLVCIGNFLPGSTGWCASECLADSDCSGITTSSGTIAPTCEPTSPLESGCVLNCADAPEGCPDGMECGNLALLERCIYP